jgi:hypothetical protein
MHVHIVNLCMHVPVISISLYKMSHNYFSAKNNCYDLISVSTINKL